MSAETRHEYHALRTLPAWEPGSVGSERETLLSRLETDNRLMSWVRTAATLIEIGFTVAQCLPRFNHAPFAPAGDPHLPWVLGLLLIVIGTLALVYACFEYLMSLRQVGDALRDSRTAGPVPGLTLALPVAVAVYVRGLLAFLAVFPPTAG